jgi:hypothetical protein
MLATYFIHYFLYEVHLFTFTCMHMGTHMHTCIVVYHKYITVNVAHIILYILSSVIFSTKGTTHTRAV